MVSVPEIGYSVPHRNKSCYVDEINLVEQHPHLYYCSTKSYKSARLRENSWNQIAEAINADAKFIDKIVFKK